MPKPLIVVLTGALLGGCAGLAQKLTGGADTAAPTPCDQSFKRMNAWAQGLIPPVPQGERQQLTALARDTEASCSEPAAAAGLTRADAALAAAYAIQRRFEAAAEILKTAPEEDSAEALVLLANLTGQGLGVAKDRARAAELLNRAAAVGGPEFHIQAAQEFLLGDSVERDIARARALYQAAIEQNSADAMLAYATDYLGLFRPKTEPQAVAQALALVKRAANEFGSGDAMAVLTRYYLLSKSGRDLSLAAQWADKALAAGSELAYRSKGLVALAGFQRVMAGRRLDDFSQVPEGVEAAKWFRQGAEAGDPLAAAYLGELYLNGVGVPKSRAEAERWLSEARSGGSRQAAALLRRLRGETQPKPPDPS